MGLNEQIGAYVILRSTLLHVHPKTESFMTSIVVAAAGDNGTVLNGISELTIVTGGRREDEF